MKQVYVSSLLSPGASAEISGEDYQHLTRSVRARVGDELRLVDTAFAVFQGVISAIDRRAVTVRAANALPPETAGAALTLALCAPANDAFDAAFDAAVQLGITRFVPLASKHSRVPDPARLPRLTRIAREACCQSLRARPPLIEEALSLESFLTQEKADRRFLAWQEGSAAAQSFGASDSLTLVIGPEGGFEAGELDLAKQCGWQTVQLGPHVMRVPVAAAAGLSLMQHLRTT